MVRKRDAKSSPLLAIQWKNGSGYNARQALTLTTTNSDGLDKSTVRLMTFSCEIGGPGGG